MDSIIIQIKPEFLDNPDADLRYLIAKELSNLSSDDIEIIEDGYDYSEDNDDMYIFLIVSDHKKFIEIAKKYLLIHKILNNNVLNSCIISIEKNKNHFEVLYKFDKSVEFKFPG